MSTRKVFSIIGLCLSALLIVCLFLPVISSYGESYSLWKTFEMFGFKAAGVIVIIELCVCVLAFILQLVGVTKDAKLAYLGLGYFFTYHILLFATAAEGNVLSQLAFGYWFGLILSIATLVMIIVGSCVSNETKQRYAPMKPTRYDPETGKPIYEAPKEISGYDPQTGQPIYK